MANLQAYVNDGIEIYVDNETGESFASVSGYARMSGKANQRISERLSSSRFSDAKYAEVLTSRGLRTSRLIPEDAIVEWLPKDNPEMAQKLMKLGVRKFLHTLAGYEPPQQKTKVLSPGELLALQSQAIIALENETKKLRELTEANEVRISNMEMHTTGHQDYYSLKAYVNLNNINMSNRNWSQTGKRLTDFSKKLAYEIKLVPDAKFGRVQAYHRDVLNRWFEGG